MKKGVEKLPDSWRMTSVGREEGKLGMGKDDQEESWKIECVDANNQEEISKLGLNGTLREDKKQCGASPVGITNCAVDIGHRFHRDGPNRRVFDAIIGVILAAQFPNALWCPRRFFEYTVNSTFVDVELSMCMVEGAHGTGNRVHSDPVNSLVFSKNQDSQRHPLRLKLESKEKNKFQNFILS